MIFMRYISLSLYIYIYTHIYIYIYIYVCMYVCMYACMYVFMYACMQVIEWLIDWLIERVSEWVSEWVSFFLDLRPLGTSLFRGERGCRTRWVPNSLIITDACPMMSSRPYASSLCYEAICPQYTERRSGGRNFPTSPKVTDCYSVHPGKASFCGLYPCISFLPLCPSQSACTRGS